jgi:K+-sensing histidine kinase KdpD
VLGVNERSRRIAGNVLAGVVAIAAPVLLTILLLLLGGGESRNFAFLFLIVVALIALLGPFWSGLLSAALSFLLMDFFFVAPRYTLTIADPDDLIDLILFFGTAILIGLLEWRRSKARLAAESLSQQLQLANADLIRLNREEAMAAQAAIRLARTEQQVATLRESDRYRRELLANVSHDLRTPIATILTRSTAGAGGSEPPEASLGIIADEARRLDDLVRDLLDMTRIESGALELDLEAIRLMEAIEAAAERLQRRSPHRTVVIPDDPRTAGVEVLADWARLGQILDNLLWNADRYSPAGARIEFRIDDEDPEFAGVRVVDHGPGVAPELREHLFDRFVRGDTERSNPQGTGLGLAIVRGLVEAQAGQVSLDPQRPGEGAGFRFTLPLTATEDAGG